VVAEFDGSWRQRIRWRRVRNDSPRTSSSTPTGSTSSDPLTSSKRSVKSALFLSTPDSTANTGYNTLLDLTTLRVIPKVVRPLEKQLPDESRKLWVRVTTNLLEKEFSDATKEKVKIEQKQRDDAAERKRKGIE
jgi:oxysterol-binding protein-related protein 9/10/11